MQGSKLEPSMLYSKQHKGKCGSMAAGLLNLAKQITVSSTDTRKIILLLLLSQTCALGQKNQFGNFWFFLNKPSGMETSVQQPEVWQY